METPQSVVEYRDVAGFPGYRAGSDGTIWSCRDYHGGFRSEWRQLKPRADKDGYLSVTLNVSGVSKTRKVAHIILEAFVGARPHGAESCHFPDIDRTNNRVENLRWDTHKSNSQDKVKSGTIARGERHGMVKLIADQVLEIRRLRSEEGLTYVAIGKRFGISEGHTHLIIKRKNWKHI